VRSFNYLGSTGMLNLVEGLRREEGYFGLNKWSCT